MDTEQARSAHAKAEKFQQCIASNGDKAATFECTLIEDFNKCISCLHKGKKMKGKDVDGVSQTPNAKEETA